MVLNNSNDIHRVARLKGDRFLNRVPFVIFPSLVLNRKNTHSRVEISNKLFMETKASPWKDIAKEVKPVNNTQTQHSFESTMNSEPTNLSSPMKNKNSVQGSWLTKAQNKSRITPSVALPATNTDDTQAMFPALPSSGANTSANNSTLSNSTISLEIPMSEENTLQDNSTNTASIDKNNTTMVTTATATTVGTSSLKQNISGPTHRQKIDYFEPMIKEIDSILTKILSLSNDASSYEQSFSTRYSDARDILETKPHQSTLSTTSQPFYPSGSTPYYHQNAERRYNQHTPFMPSSQAPIFTPSSIAPLSKDFEVCLRRLEHELWIQLLPNKSTALVDAVLDHSTQPLAFWLILLSVAENRVFIVFLVNNFSTIVRKCSPSGTYDRTTADVRDIVSSIVNSKLSTSQNKSHTTTSKTGKDTTTSFTTFVPNSYSLVSDSSTVPQNMTTKSTLLAPELKKNSALWSILIEIITDSDILLQTRILLLHRYQLGIYLNDILQEFGVYPTDTIMCEPSHNMHIAIIVLFNQFISEFNAAQMPSQQMSKEQMGQFRDELTSALNFIVTYEIEIPFSKIHETFYHCAVALYSIDSKSFDQSSKSNHASGKSKTNVHPLSNSIGQLLATSRYCMKVDPVYALQTDVEGVETHSKSTGTGNVGNTQILTSNVSSNVSSNNLSSMNSTSNSNTFSSPMSNTYGNIPYPGINSITTVFQPIKYSELLKHQVKNGLTHQQLYDYYISKQLFAFLQTLPFQLQTGYLRHILKRAEIPLNFHPEIADQQNFGALYFLARSYKSNDFDQFFFSASNNTIVSVVNKLSRTPEAIADVRYMAEKFNVLDRTIIVSKESVRFEDTLEYKYENEGLDYPYEYIQLPDDIPIVWLHSTLKQSLLNETITQDEINVMNTKLELTTKFFHSLIDSLPSIKSTMKYELDDIDDQNKSNDGIAISKETQSLFDELSTLSLPPLYEKSREAAKSKLHDPEDPRIPSPYVPSSTGVDRNEILTSLKKHDEVLERINMTKCNIPILSKRYPLIVGADTESTLTYCNTQGKVVLLQLYIGGICFLIDLLRYGQDVDSMLSIVLNDPRTLVVGVAFGSDLSILRSSLYDDIKTSHKKKDKEKIKSTTSQTFVNHINVLDLQHVNSRFYNSDRYHTTQDDVTSPSAQSQVQGQGQGQGQGQLSSDMNDIKTKSPATSPNNSMTTPSNISTTIDDLEINPQETEEKESSEENGNSKKPLKPQPPQAVSLRRMVKAYLYLDLFKFVQVSNWGRRPLSNPKISYACIDAWVQIPLLNALLEDVEESKIIEYLNEQKNASKHS